MDGGAWWAAVHGVTSIGEGNGNSLQYSCLENPRDKGAWRAAVYGVAQSRKRLKWLSSSSSSSSSSSIILYQYISICLSIHLIMYACCAALLQPCLTLCDPIDCSPLAPLSVEFARQEYWSGLPCPSPGDLPDLGTEPNSLMSPAMAGGFFTTSATRKPVDHIYLGYLCFRPLEIRLL